MYVLHFWDCVVLSVDCMITAIQPVGLIDRRATTLASAFGSSSSLNSAIHPQFCSVPTRLLENITMHKGSDTDSMADSESSSRGSRNTSNGPVQFELGEDNRQVIMFHPHKKIDWGLPFQCSCWIVGGGATLAEQTCTNPGSLTHTTLPHASYF